jgi:hypothetical protein
LFHRRRLGLNRDELDGRFRLGFGPGLGLGDQPFTEAPRSHFGAITATLDGQVGALPFSRPISVSIAIAVSRALVHSFDAVWITRWRAERAIAASIAVAVAQEIFDSFGAEWIAGRRADRRVNGIRGRRPAAGIAASVPVALTAGITAAFAFARRGRIGRVGAGRAAFEVL